jgi:S-(hydroxymethyl)glutathione dehydrogenase/alcohol dehydrogenase
MYGNTDPETDLPLLLDHYRAGRLDLATLVTNKIPLDDVDSAFDHLRTGHGARTLILFDPPP